MPAKPWVLSESEVLAIIQETANEAAGTEDRQTKGKTDGWGIQRTFDRDLGGARHSVVKAPTPHAEADPTPSLADVMNEKYTGKTLVKDPSLIRSLDELFSTRWKDLTKPEIALLKNLGWNQQMWDTKDTPAGKWPIAMATPFINLTPVQREAVRKLGIPAPDWDRRIQALRH